MSLFNFDLKNTRLAMAGGLLVLGAGAFAGGCNTGFAYPTEADFCAAQAQAECNSAVVDICYGADDSSPQFDTDTRSCEEGRSRSTNCNPSGLPYHPEQADQCVAAQQALWQSGSFGLADYQAVQQACLPTFNKGGGEGSSCTADSDCDVGNNLLCVIHSGENGNCRIPVQVMAGLDCSRADAQCATGFYCDEGRHCVEQPNLNEACGLGKPCADGLLCDAKENVCLAKSKDGSSCRSDEECAGGFCISSGGSSKGLCSSTFRLEFSTTCSGFR